MRRGGTRRHVASTDMWRSNRYVRRVAGACQLFQGKHYEQPKISIELGALRRAGNSGNW